jgi:hypothetical protein
MISINKNTIKVIIPQFITHIEKTNNKIASNKFIKINNQLIYNSNLNRFARNIVVINMHNYIISHINKKFQLNKYPYQISLNFYAPINYGSISRRFIKSEKDFKIICKEPSKDYTPNWDIGNYGDIWLKTFADALQIKGCLKDDNVKYIKSIGPTTFIQEDLFENRKLEFIIKPI